MADTKLTANGYSLTAWWALPNAFANPANPTVAELNAADEITDSISWASFSFGSKASNQIADPSMIDVGNTQTRGFSQFGGSVGFFYPYAYNDATNNYYSTFLNFVAGRVLGYLIFRIDGQKTTAAAPVASKLAIANDFVRIYKVMSDGYTDNITGEDNFKYQITFQPQGTLYINAFIGTVVVVTPVPIGTPNYVSATKGKTPLGTYITGRQLSAVTSETNGYPGWFTWSSSAPAVATVDQNGVVTAQSAGTANIVATDKKTGVASTALAITCT